MTTTISKQFIRTQRQMFSGQIEIYLIAEDSRGSFIAKPVQMEKMAEGLMQFPTMQLDPTTAQMLMDELWNCGIKPSQGSGSAGALAATERHLADMQRLVFKNK